MKVRWFLSAAAIVLMLALSACGGSPESVDVPDPLDSVGTEVPELTPPPMPAPGDLMPPQQDPGIPEVEIEPVQPDEG